MTFVTDAPPQRIEFQKQVTAAADGTATFLFDYTPEGVRYTGTVQIKGASIVAGFTANVNIVPWGAWSGGLPFGPIQVDGRQRLEVDATGLNAGVVYTAIFVGKAEADYPTGLLHPLPLAAPPNPTRIIQSVTTTSSSAPVSTAPIDCSGYPAARYSFLNQAFFSNCQVFLTWYDTQAAALAPTATNLAAQRVITIGSGQQAAFAFPHAADWLVIQFVSLDAGAYSVIWAASHRLAPVSYWTVGNDGYLLLPGSHTFAGTGTFNPTGFGGIYAGPAVVQLDTTSNAASGTGWTLQALQTNNTFVEIASVYPDAQGGTTNNTPRKQFPVLIPPATLQLTLSNQTGAANTVSYAIIPDDWRTGG